MRFTAAVKSSPPGPYRGLLWTAGLAAVLLILLLGGSLFSSGGKAPKRRAAAPPPAPPRRTTAPAAPAWHKPDPEPDKIPFQLKDPNSLKTAADSQTLDSDAFYYLLYQLKHTDPARLARQATRVQSPADLSARKPGDAVLLEGTVRAVRSRPKFAVREAGIDNPGQYDIEDPRGHTYLVFATYRAVDVAEGDRVRVVGRFLRFYPYVPFGKEDLTEAVPTPVVITRMVTGTRYLSDPSCLRQVNDKGFGQEAKPFYYLVRRIQGRPQRELRQQVDPEVTTEMLLHAPARYRGRLVAVQGVLIAPPQAMDEPPNAAGVERTWRTFLRTRDGKNVWVYTVEHPGELEERQLVRAYGAFFKIRPYADLRGYEQKAILVVARRLVTVRVETPPHLPLVAVVIGLVTLVLLALAVFIERKKSREVGAYVHSLAARSRPRDLNRAARAAAARARQALEERERETEQQPPPPPSDDVGKTDARDE